MGGFFREKLNPRKFTPARVPRVKRSYELIAQTSFTFVQLLWVGVHLGHDKAHNTILSS